MVVYNFDVGNYNNLCKTGNHVAGLQKNFFFFIFFHAMYCTNCEQKKNIVLLLFGLFNNL